MLSLVSLCARFVLTILTFSLCALRKTSPTSCGLCLILSKPSPRKSLRSSQSETTSFGWCLICIPRQDKTLFSLCSKNSCQARMMIPWPGSSRTSGARLLQALRLKRLPRHRLRHRLHLLHQAPPHHVPGEKPAPSRSPWIQGMAARTLARLARVERTRKMWCCKLPSG